MAAELTGASVWEQKLFGILTSHEAAERSLLEQYRDAAEDSGSPAFRYLVALILEDEVRHHRLFRDLADALRTDAELRSGEPAVPRPDR
jgi:hypothetical protein